MRWLVALCVLFALTPAHAETAIGYVQGRKIKIAVVDVDGVVVEKRTADAFAKMAEAADADGIALELTSGFRTNERQAELYDEYLHASGTTLTARDRAVLAKYDRLIDGAYCRPHCGACLDSCVAGLPIDDVLRYAMYFEDYRSEKEAMRLYAGLGGLDASRCIGCAAPCAGSCPHGLVIQSRMLDAHRMLTPA